MSAPLLCDGPMPAELTARDVLAHPERVVEAHRAWVDAGARLLRTFTGTLGPASPEEDLSRLEAICGWSERLARASGAAAVAGHIGAGAAADRAILKRLLDALLIAGVDLFWLDDLGGELQGTLALIGLAGKKAVVTRPVSDATSVLGLCRIVPANGLSPEQWRVEADRSDAAFLSPGAGATPAHLAALRR